MLKPNFSPPLFRILFLLTALVFVLSGCSRLAPRTPTPESPTPDITAKPESVSATPQPSLTSQAPLSIRLESQLRPAIDKTCLVPGEGFTLRSAPLPEAGLEPGVSYLFCATGAPDGATVEFLLISPAGDRRTFTAISGAQDGVTVAPLTLRFSADDPAGQWTLRAGAGGAESELSFTLLPATRPYIALREPIAENAKVIRAEVGGLPPGSTSRFALYTLKNTPATTDELVATDGALLISTRLVADDFGRADLELFVEDLPSGPYLLVLIPPGVDLGAPPTLHLPEQEQLLVTANLIRTAVAARSSEAPPAESTQPLMPQPASSSGGLPETILVELPATQMPSCAPADNPALQIWPEQGEVGNWWLGCASGFVPSSKVNLEVTLANGKQTLIPLEIKSDGSAYFRWYALPGEGVGPVKAEVTSSSGKAEISWSIAEPSRPHMLVFPHDVTTDVGGELVLTGFQPDTQVDLGLYRINEQGTGVRIKQWQVRTNKRGMYSKGFTQAFGLNPGNYLLVAQSSSAYTFPNIDLTATAVEYFSYNADLNDAYDAYTLYLGRTGEVATTATPTPAPSQPVAEAAPTPTPAPTAVAEIPPPAISLTEDTSTPPACPDANGSEPVLCLLPTSFPQGTFTYILMHGFKPGAKIAITISPPRGADIELSRRTVDDKGFADAYFYALNTDALGDYTVRVKVGKAMYNGTFTVVAPTNPHLVIQPRSAKPGTSVIASVTGFEPNEALLFVRYRSTNTANGQVNFEMVDKQTVTTDKDGGAQIEYRVSKKKGKNRLFVVRVYRPGASEPVVQAVYGGGVDMGVRYPFDWGQNYQEE